MGYTVTVTFCRHWYITEGETLESQTQCSGWQELDWEDYQVAWHSAHIAMGDGNPLRLLGTDTRNFEYKGE